MFIEEIELTKVLSKTQYVSLGNYCLTSMILKDNNLKDTSYPFDWMVSCIDNVSDIIEDEFNQFLNRENYQIINGQTKNCIYNTNINKLFSNVEAEHMHHDLSNREHYEYLTRCIERFDDLNNFDKIVFVMIQPLYLQGVIPDNEKCLRLYNLLISKFGSKIKLPIFNITKVKNEIYQETVLNENLIVYELKSTIATGAHSMQWYDEEGLVNFLNIVKDA